MTTEQELTGPKVRTYGGWRRSRDIGLFGLGPAATVTVLGSILAPLLTASVSLQAGATVALPAAAVAGFTLARVGGISLARLAQRRLRWAWGSARGYPSLRAGRAASDARGWRLPGPLAPTQLVSADDGRGGQFGLVWNQRTGTLTATLRCAATSTWLVDGRDADGWVSNWHSWLASLGYLPIVRWIAVTVDTAPEPGTALRDHVLPRLDRRAPADAQALMHELVRRSPAASADIDTRVSVPSTRPSPPSGCESCTNRPPKFPASSRDSNPRYPPAG